MAEGWTKLTPEREERLIALLRAGQYRSSACAAVGISDRTFRNWLEKGEQGDVRFSELSRKVREAEADAENRVIVQILIHGKEDWRALSWWAERRFPNRWGDAKAASIKLEHERENMLDALVKVLERRGIADAAEDIFRELAGVGGEPTGVPASPSSAKH